MNRENLAPLSAQSLYRLLEEHSSHPLHAAVRLGREDVVFLDLIKYTQQVIHVYFFYSNSALNHTSTQELRFWLFITDHNRGDAKQVKFSSKQSQDIVNEGY